MSKTEDLPSRHEEHQETDCNISDAECESMCLLYEDGWTKGELKMTFLIEEYSTLNKHLRGECVHRHHKNNNHEVK